MYTKTPLSINTRAIKYCGSGLSIIGVNTKKEIINLNHKKNSLNLPKNSETQSVIIGRIMGTLYERGICA